MLKEALKENLKYKSDQPLGSQARVSFLRSDTLGIATIAALMGLARLDIDVKEMDDLFDTILHENYRTPCAENKDIHDGAAGYLYSLLYLYQEFAKRVPMVGLVPGAPDNCTSMLERQLKTDRYVKRLETRIREIVEMIAKEFTAKLHAMKATVTSEV